MKSPLEYRKNFPCAAILGTGTMGAQLAALFVNSGVDTVLFGLSAEENEQETAAGALKRLPQMKPPPLVLPEYAQHIQTADYKNDLSRLAKCSLVIEAVSEKMEIKQHLYNLIGPHLATDAILASNTSGLSIQELSAQLDPPLRERFCGIHFFNPPRFMPLVELIAQKNIEEKRLHQLEGFLSIVLGKEVVRAQDTPGFIANRLGMFSMAAVFHWMKEFNIAPDTVDELTGSLIGRAKSACFRTADIVGLDILDNVMKHLKTQLSHDPWQRYFELPDWVSHLQEQGFLGAKSGKGVYHKTKENILVFDPEKNDYRPIKKNKSKEISRIFAAPLAEVLPHLAASSDPQARFLWAIHRDLFHYASIHLADIANDIRTIDTAMRSGFGWKEGVFEFWHKSGGNKITRLLAEDIKQGNALSAMNLPGWTSRGLYTQDGAWSAKHKRYIAPSSHPLFRRQLLRKIIARQPELDVVHEDEELRLINLKDGIAALSFKTKMHTLSYELLLSFNKLLDELETNYSALIIWQPEAPFCAGANLYQILAGAKLGKTQKVNLMSSLKQRALETFNPKLPKLGDLPSIKEVLVHLQNLFMRLKHGPIPTVAAVQGIAIGGGCELLLHCDKVVATMESYIGLVEMGVGVIPAGGGSKEMAQRATELSQGTPFFSRLAQFFEQIALAKISSSAQEAAKMGYLRDRDKIIANPYELLYVAKAEAQALLESDYRPPPRRKDISVLGRPGIANFLAQLSNLREGSFISQHDYLCARVLAETMCGGELDENEKVSADWFLHLERRGFIRLLETPLTQKRIEYMLRKNKPLRN